VRHGLAELDFGIAGTRIVFLVGRPYERRRQRRGREGGDRGGAEFAPGLPVLHGHCFSLDACFSGLAALC
jgi:hypothetical protein